MTLRGGGGKEGAPRLNVIMTQILKKKLGNVPLVIPSALISELVVSVYC